MDSPIDLAGAAVPGVRRQRYQALTIRTAAGLAVALLFLVTFLRLVNVSSVYQRLQHLSIGLAGLCGLVFLSAYVVRALRWRWFLAPHRVAGGGYLSGGDLYQLAVARAGWRAGQEPVAAAPRRHPHQPLPADSDHG